MESLERALIDQRVAIERELGNAEAELIELRSRERRLLDVIQRARAFLDQDGAPAPREFSPRPTEAYLPLHEALARILRENSNGAMSARELADAVNRSGLYQKRDGSPVDSGQVHARVHNYDRMFVRTGRGIKLRDVETADASAELLERFDAAMLEVYASAMREARYPARRFLAMVRGRGGLEAAHELLAKPGVSEGFRRLAEARKLNLTMEFQVLTREFRGLFAADELDIARARLLEFGLPKNELPH